MKTNYSMLMKKVSPRTVSCSNACVEQIALYDCIQPVNSCQRICGLLK